MAAAAARDRAEKDVGARESAKGRPQGLWGRFYSARKARGGDGRSNGHQWPWGPAASRHSRGGNLNGEETGEIDGRGVKLVLQYALMEA
jgi:hypothetical protein